MREGRLHPIHRGVYAVGRAELSRRGTWIAALLACGWKHPNGPELIALSHDTAGANLRVCAPTGPTHISLDAAVVRRRLGIETHRRRLRPTDVTIHAGIPVTSPVITLIDLATTLTDHQLEAAINEADRIDLISSPSLLSALDRYPRRPGIGRLRTTLTRHSLALPTSELESLFLPIAARAGLPPPLTQQRVNGYRVDFYWPDLGLVVETDGLRYHRTGPSRPATRGAIRLTHWPASSGCASPTTRSPTSRWSSSARSRVSQNAYRGYWRYERRQLRSTRKARGRGRGI